MKVINWLENISFDNGLEIKALLKTHTSKEIQIVMPQNEVMKEHKAPGMISVQLLQGHIWFEVEGGKYELKKGDMINLQPNVPHSLGGIENSVIRLTLSLNDDVKRVKSVGGL